jgi:hypothetical protein
VYDVGGLLTTLLDLVQTGFNDAGVELPSVAYVAPGSIAAYDGEQITVNLGRIFPGRPGAEQSYQHVREELVTAELLVAIVRNSPVPDDQGNPPSATTLARAGLSCILDATTLRSVLTAIRDSYSLVGVGIPVFVGPVATEGPMGGVHAVTGRVQVQLV